MKPKPRVPVWRWTVWSLALFAGADPVLRALHAVLVRPAGAGVDGRVPVAAPPLVTAAEPGPGKIRAEVGELTYVYDFEEPCEGGRELLGGKGIGLAEMTQLGVRVPAGFTITTDACRAFMRTHELPEGLEAEVDEHVGRLEAKTGKRFGSNDDPLLVSVRSGAAVSMPGMMDTILNLGLNDEAAEGLAARTSNPRFAFDSYRRLIQMYGEVVDGIDGHRFETALTELKAARGVQQDTDLSADDLRALVETFKRIYADETGGGFPDGREGAAAQGGAGGVSQLGEPAGAGLPARARDPGGDRHRGERRADGVREQGRPLGDGCGVHA